MIYEGRAVCEYNNIKWKAFRLTTNKSCRCIFFYVCWSYRVILPCYFFSIWVFWFDNKESLFITSNKIWKNVWSMKNGKNNINSAYLHNSKKPLRILQYKVCYNQLQLYCKLVITYCHEPWKNTAEKNSFAPVLKKTRKVKTKGKYMFVVSFEQL